MPPRDIYGKKFESLIDNDLISTLDSELTAIAKEIGRIPDKKIFVVQQRPVILKEIADKTIIAFNEATKGAYQDAHNESKSLYDKINVQTSFSKVDIEIFKTIRQDALDEALLYARNDGVKLWRALSNFAISGNTKSLNDALLTGLDNSQIKKYGNTIVNTSIDTFYRTENGVRGINAGITRYKYLGPPPERAFCKEHINRVYTIDEIRLMDNGQIGDVLYSCGGYNCRHYWGPVL